MATLCRFKSGLRYHATTLAKLAAAGDAMRPTTTHRVPMVSQLNQTAEGRERIAEAQRQRWARWRAERDAQADDGGVGDDR
jgi:hypothetical protein